MDDKADPYLSILAEADAEFAAAAMVIAATTYASVSLADRLRGSVGQTISASVRGLAGPEGVVGQLAEVVVEGIVVRTAPGRALVVTWGGIDLITGLQPGHRTEEDSETPRRLSRVLYPAGGCELDLALVTGRPLSGRLLRVGSDHLELHSTGGALVVGFPAISWLQSRVADQFESSGSGLSLR